MMFETNKYTLFNKDTKIMDFHCERDEMNNPNFVMDKKYSDKLPYGFTDTNTWIENRRAPRNREHIKQILSKCGCNDLEGFIRFTHGASLNDTFWIKSEGSNLSWDNVSWYRNPFDTNIAKIAFDGGLMGDNMSSPSPETSTDGTVAKCWRRFGNDIYLLKRGNKLVSFDGIESYGLGPYSEQYAYCVSKEICKNPLPYEVISYHGKDASKCKLFCSEDVSYAPISYVIGPKAKFKDCLEFYESIGFGEQFKEMLVLDTLIINEDRHLKNFGVLYDANDMQITGMAPVFDNNLALFPNNRLLEIQKTDSALANTTSPFGLELDELGRRCMTPAIKSKVINLRDFEFPREYKKSLDEDRLSALEKIIQVQAGYLVDKKIYMARTKDEIISLDSLSLKIDAASLDEKAKEIFTSNDFSIPAFDIITKSGEIVHVNKCSCEAIPYTDNANTYIDLDIYDASISGTSTSLEVDKFHGFMLVSNKTLDEIHIAIDEVNVQLSGGKRTAITTLNDMNIVCSDGKTQNKFIRKDDGRGHSKVVPAEISEIADMYETRSVDGETQEKN